MKKPKVIIIGSRKPTENALAHIQNVKPSIPNQNIDKPNNLGNVDISPSKKEKYPEIISEASPNIDPYLNMEFIEDDPKVLEFVANNDFTPNYGNILHHKFTDHTQRKVELKKPDVMNSSGFVAAGNNKNQRIIIRSKPGNNQNPPPIKNNSPATDFPVGVPQESSENSPCLILPPLLTNAQNPMNTPPPLYSELPTSQNLHPPIITKNYPYGVSSQNNRPPPPNAPLNKELPTTQNLPPPIITNNYPYGVSNQNNLPPPPNTPLHKELPTSQYLPPPIITDSYPYGVSSQNNLIPPPNLFEKRGLKEFLNNSCCLVCEKKFCNFVSPCEHTYHLKCVFSVWEDSFQCKKCRQIISLNGLELKNKDLCYCCQSGFNLFQCEQCRKKHCYSCVLKNPLAGCCEGLKNGIKNLTAQCPGCSFQRSVNDLVQFSCHNHNMLCKKCWNLSTELNKCILGHDLYFKHQDIILCSNCNKKRIKGFTEYYCTSDCEYCEVCSSQNLLSQEASKPTCICGSALRRKQEIIWN